NLDNRDHIRPMAPHSVSYNLYFGVHPANLADARAVAQFAEEFDSLDLHPLRGLREDNPLDIAFWDLSRDSILGPRKATIHDAREYHLLLSDIRSLPLDEPGLFELRVRDTIVLIELKKAEIQNKVKIEIIEP